MPCETKAAGKPAEPPGFGPLLTIPVDCVITVNTVFEHGVIRGPPLADDEASNHPMSIGRDEKYALTAEVHAKVNDPHHCAENLELEHIIAAETDPSITEVNAVGLKCL